MEIATSTRGTPKSRGSSSSIRSRSLSNSALAIDNRSRRNMCARRPWIAMPTPVFLSRARWVIESLNWKRDLATPLPLVGTSKVGDVADGNTHHSLARGPFLPSTGFSSTLVLAVATPHDVAKPGE